ncbi:MAG: hypothetical protein D6715_08735 [Calditrichaeota bacterium]|nr:MAG: hypothetical protein D6715_08735 [Calditrichota bacterium]
MDFKQIALEYVKLYFTCHPEELPKDREKAFKEMSRLYTNYKNKLIESAHKKSEDFFSDKF